MAAPESGDTEAVKLTLYFNEELRCGRELAADLVIDLFARARVRTSVLIRGIEGFGAHHRMHTDRLETAGLNQPLVAVAVDRPDRIESLHEPVDSILSSGLITAERAWLTAGGELPEVAHEAVKLTVYCGRDERTRSGERAHRAVVAALQAAGAAGATALLGVDGTLHGTRRRATFFSRNRDVPVMVVAIGERGQIEAALAAIRRLDIDPVTTVEGIRVCKRDGRTLAPPAAGAGDTWCKLMVHAAGDARVEGDALHYQLVEQLRRSGAAGATSLRGQWGFRDAEPPHGDTVRTLRRTSPVLTIAIDHDGGTASSWAVIDRLTAQTGLVTSELVPAHRGAPR
jgi:PII-like signaling protein